MKNGFIYIVSLVFLFFIGGNASGINFGNSQDFDFGQVVVQKSVPQKNTFHKRIPRHAVYHSSNIVLSDDDFQNAESFLNFTFISAVAVFAMVSLKLFSEKHQNSALAFTKPVSLFRRFIVFRNLRI